VGSQLELFDFAERSRERGSLLLNKKKKKTKMLLTYKNQRVEKMCLMGVKERLQTQDPQESGKKEKKRRFNSGNKEGRSDMRTNEDQAETVRKSQSKNGKVVRGH